MTRVFARLAAVTIATVACSAPAQPVASAGPTPTPEVPQDQQVLRLAERLLPYCPDSTFRIARVEDRTTPSGAYRIVQVDRSCQVEYLSTPTTLIVDDVAGMVWEGTIGRLPTREQNISGNQLRPFLNQFLPQVLRQNLRMSTSIDWDGGGIRSGALISFTLLVDSGYGVYKKPSAVTSDGEFLVLGAAVPLASDPVADRRAALASSRLVIWDHEASGAKVEIVEFSDFECPACKSKWPVVAKVLDKHPSAVRHGMVGFPLSTIHPWAFRAASAAWCVGVQQPGMTLGLKELFYSMQREMELEQVTPTSLDFVAGNGLSEADFSACYLKPPSIDAVHDQLTLGNGLGIAVTPTYIVNGWKVQVPNEEWFLPMIDRLVAGSAP